ncbi:MAG: XRE family transcriptional regulator, partial [Bacteroidetes bacterium]
LHLGIDNCRLKNVLWFLRKIIIYFVYEHGNAHLFCLPSDFYRVKNISSKSLRKKLGQRVRQLRKQQKISQAQLAFESGLSREEVYRLEQGNKNPTTDTLHAIASSLEVHIRELYEFEY